MSEHDRIRELLPLSAAGDVSAEDIRSIREHLACCESCRRICDDLSTLSSALRAMPTPQPRPEIINRVRSFADSRLKPKPGPGEARMVPWLVASSWAVALLTWPVTRAAAGLMLNLWQIPGEGLITVLVFYSVAGLLSACLAAFAVARYSRVNGRTR